jgi:ATP-dependent Clp protease protease subunit
MNESKLPIGNTIDNILDEELLNTRRVFVFGDIDDTLTEDVIKRLIYLSSSKDPIIVLICSDGGSVECGSAILDTINVIKTSCIVKTVAYKACSAAADILAMGTKGYRYAFPTSVVMLHKTSIELPMDDEDKQRLYIEFMKKQGNAINSMIAKACGKTTDRFMKDISPDLWLNSSEAKKYKIVDHIVKTLDEI